jgi:hypothetical protein
MNALSFLSALAGTFSLILGVFVFLRAPENRTNRMFFLMSLCQNLWCFTGVVIFSAPDRDTFNFWYKAGSPFFITYYPASLHFCWLLTRKMPLGLEKATALYLPSLVICLAAFPETSHIQVFEKTGDF